MGKGRYSIVFNSPTGNTKKLADTIYAVLPKENCDYFGVPKEGDLYSEMLYIGFWTDKGNADKSTLTLPLRLVNSAAYRFSISGQGIVCAFFTHRLLSFRFMPTGCLKSARLICPLL